MITDTTGADVSALGRGGGWPGTACWGTTGWTSTTA